MDINEILRLIMEEPYAFAKGYEEAESDFGSMYDSSDRNEAYDIGRQLGRSYIFGIKE